MFPLNSNLPYIKDDGTRDKLGNVIGSGGGGGGSYTPDYEHDVLIIGEHDDFKYYIPMSKEYIGEGIEGYEIETDPYTSTSKAMIDVYRVVYNDGELKVKTLLKKLVHDEDKNYEDDNISITYSNLKWSVTSKVSLYNESGVIYDSPLLWSYDETVDYLMLLEDPTA